MDVLEENLYYVLRTLASLRVQILIPICRVCETSICIRVCRMCNLYCIMYTYICIHTCVHAYELYIKVYNNNKIARLSPYT